jgi:hypothetical protein
MAGRDTFELNCGAGAVFSPPSAAPRALLAGSSPARGSFLEALPLEPLNWFYLSPTLQELSFRRRLRVEDAIMFNFIGASSSRKPVRVRGVVLELQVVVDPLWKLLELHV